MPIYTRRGDKGETSLFGGTRLLKSAERVDTYGTVDELNSVLGVAIAHLPASLKAVKQMLEGVQNDLFSIGAYLANPNAESIPGLVEKVEAFEKTIDEQMSQLPELHNFILPGGGEAGASLHQARTVCRRAERRLVSLMQTEEIDEHVVKFINRLSDLLFSTARFVNHQEKKKETIWLGRKARQATD